MMANMHNRSGDYDYRPQNRWTENNEDRGRDWDGDRQMNIDRGRGNFERNREDFDWNYNQGGDGMGRGRRIWDQESGMYNESPGYGRSTEAGRRGSEFYGGGSSFGGWGRGGYGQYNEGTFGGGYGRGEFDRGDYNRGGSGGEHRGAGRYRDIPFENQQQYSDYMSRGGGDRFDEGTYFGGGRSGEGRFGAGNRSIEGMYSGGFGGFNRGGSGGWGRMNEGPGQGPHTGRGPRGYKRSDERIREDVSEELERHGWIDASDVEVEVHDGEVTLKGTVEDRSQKRMAEDAAERVTGVKDVHNELRVQSQRGGEHDRDFGREHTTVETGHASAGGAAVANTHVTAARR